MQRTDIDFARTLGALPEAVVVVDAAGMIRHANSSAQALHADLVAGVAFEEAFAPEERRVAAHYLGSLFSLNPGHPSRYMEAHLRAERDRRTLVAIKGRPVPGSRADAVLVLVDITEQRAREEALQSLAHTDPLTGLPNRLALLRTLRAAAGADSGCVVAMADLDGFKHINDQYGHDAGDTLLKAVAARWRDMLPQQATLARLGGDEFCIVLPGPLDSTALDCLQPLCGSDLAGDLAKPNARAVTVSIGVAHSNAGSVDEVLRQCDMAMYAAKGRGRNQVAVYGPEAIAHVEQRLDQAELIRRLNEQNAQLHRDARTDARTGLANARALSEVESQEVWPSGAEPWQAAAVLFIDLDHFGAYNHRYGDSAGDEALRRVATMLQAAGRKSDLVFRKGGEEFVLVLPMADASAAQRVAEAVARQLADLRIQHADGPTGWLSALIVGTLVRPGETLRQAIARAGDFAMGCKAEGTRAVIVFTDVLPTAA